MRNCFLVFLACFCVAIVTAKDDLFCTCGDLCKCMATAANGVRKLERFSSNLAENVQRHLRTCRKEQEREYGDGDLINFFQCAQEHYEVECPCLTPLIDRLAVTRDYGSTRAKRDTSYLAEARTKRDTPYLAQRLNELIECTHDKLKASGQITRLASKSLVKKITQAIMDKTTECFWLNCVTPVQIANSCISEAGIRDSSVKKDLREIILGPN